MKFIVMTLFPELIRDNLNHSILKRGLDNNLFEVDIVDIREFSTNKHKKVDDYPYGGGSGMVMAAQPIYDAYKSFSDKLENNTPIIYMSPKGRKFDQSVAKELSKYEQIVFLCGHYEGVDERALQLVCNDCISIGDFVLTGGELPSIMMIDAISRLIPDVLHNNESISEESFENDLLEYPQYTRPYEYMGLKVPDILLSGNHGKIKEYRLKKSIEITKKYRPDLWEKYNAKDSRNK